MTRHVAEVYASQEWEGMWDAIVEKYQNISFRDLVSMAPLEDWDERSPGDFGGMGMSAQESAIFYAIGIGDGSWGAFYDVCSLYPLRTAIFGFSSQLQLIHGRVDAQGDPLASPYLQSKAVFDSKGLTFDGPRYIGLAALDECLLFMKTAETGKIFLRSLQRTGQWFADGFVRHKTQKTARSKNTRLLRLETQPRRALPGTVRGL